MLVEIFDQTPPHSFLSRPLPHIRLINRLFRHLPGPIMAPTPTKTLPLRLSGIFARQTTTTSPTSTVTVAPPANNNNSSGSSLDTGAIVGIVIGVVVAILLIIWVVRSLSAPTKAPDTDRQGWYDDDQPRRHHHHHHHNRGHRSRSRSHHSHRRHRSSTPRPVVLEEKDAYVRRPSATYVINDAGRSRSQGRSRSRSRGYYASY